MKRFSSVLAASILLFVAGVSPMKFFSIGKEAREVIELPAPQFDGDVSVEQALKARRSVRDYTDQSLTLFEISQLLWAAQGKTHPMGMRTAPSPGALYPLELFLVAGHVEGLEAGIYRYRSAEHDLVKVMEGDRRGELYKAALEQECIRDAPAVIVITAVYQRAMVKYRERGIQYTHIEVGAVAENVYLQAESLKLGTVVVGAFYDDKVKKALNLAVEEEPLAILPVGRPK